MTSTLNGAPGEVNTRFTTGTAEIMFWCNWSLSRYNIQQMKIGLTVRLKNGFMQITPRQQTKKNNPPVPHQTWIETNADGHLWLPTLCSDSEIESAIQKPKRFEYGNTIFSTKQWTLVVSLIVLFWHWIPYFRYCFSLNLKYILLLFPYGYSERWCKNLLSDVIYLGSSICIF